MKVAILLRGQPRLANLGGKLFTKFVKQEHPDIDFKIFIHAWNNINKFMIDIDNVEDWNNESFINRYKFMSHNETYDLIKDWNPEKYNIDTAKTTINLINNIIQNNLDYNEKNNVNINDLNLIRQRSIITQLLFPENNLNHNMNPGLLINLINKLGQMHSAILSYKLLEEYQKENPNYKPDLVICMRMDLYIEMDLKKLYDEIMSLKKDKSWIPILGIGGTINNGDGWLDDKIFICLPESAKYFLSGGNNRLFQTLKIDNSQCKFRLMDDSSFRMNLMWFLMADKEVSFRGIKNHSALKHDVIRNMSLFNNIINRSSKMLEKDFKLNNILNYHDRIRKIMKDLYKPTLSDSTQLYDLYNKDIEYFSK